MRISGYGGGSLYSYLKTGKSSNNSALNSIYGANGSNKLSSLNQKKNTAKTNGYLDATKTAAIGVREHAEKLTDTGKDSIFAKAKESGNTKEVVSQIKEFVKDYNSMVTNMTNAGGSANKLYGKQMSNEAASNKEAFEAIGVSVNKDGTLVVDDKKLSSAKLDDMKKLMDGSSSFVGKTSVKSIYIEAYAVSQKSQNEYNAKLTSYNSYGGYGNYNNDYSGILGSYFNGTT